MKQYYIRHVSVWILGFTIYVLSFQTPLRLLRGNTVKLSMSDIINIGIS